MSRAAALRRWQLIAQGALESTDDGPEGADLLRWIREVAVPDAGDGPA